MSRYHSMRRPYSAAQLKTVTWVILRPVISKERATLRVESPLNTRSTAVVICSGVACFLSKPRFCTNRLLQSLQPNIWRSPFLAFLMPLRTMLAESQNLHLPRSTSLIVVVAPFWTASRILRLISTAWMCLQHTSR